jgi:hypothetical protein
MGAHRLKPKVKIRPENEPAAREGACGEGQLKSGLLRAG